jgi:hypothetical protein
MYVETSIPTFMLMFVLDTSKMIQEAMDSTNVMTLGHLIACSCSFMFVVHTTTICLVIVSKWNDLLKLIKSQYGKVSMLKYGWWGWRGDLTFLIPLLQSGEKNDVVLFWWKNTMLVVGWVLLKMGLSFGFVVNFGTF